VVDGPSSRSAVEVGAQNRSAGIGAHAHAALATVSRADIVVGARRSIRLCRIRANSSLRITRSGVMTLIRRDADDRCVPRAVPPHALIDLRAGTPVVAPGAVVFFGV